MDVITLKNCDNQLKFGQFRNKTTHRSKSKQTGDLLVNTSSGNQAHSQTF